MASSALPSLHGGSRLLSCSNGKVQWGEMDTFFLASPKAKHRQTWELYWYYLALGQKETSRTVSGMTKLHYGHFTVCLHNLHRVLDVFCLVFGYFHLQQRFLYKESFTPPCDAVDQSRGSSWKLTDRLQHHAEYIRGCLGTVTSGNVWHKLVHGSHLWWCGEHQKRLPSTPLML